MLTLLHSIADITPIAILLIEGSDWCTYANMAWVQLTGLDRTASLGSGWSQALSEEDKKMILQRCTELSDDRPTQPFEIVINQKNHQNLWVQVTIHEMFSDNCIARVCVFSNITNIIGVTTQLSRSRDEIRLLAEAIPQFVWSAKDDGTIEYFNKPWIDYTGVPVEKFVKDVTLESIVHPDDYPATRAKWLHALEAKVALETEYRLRCQKDNSYKWFLARATPVYDEAGLLIRWVGTATDIDKQKRSAEKLQFVLEAANAFNATLEMNEICDRFAHLAVTYFSDWCFINLEGSEYESKKYFYAHKEHDKHKEFTEYYNEQSIEDKKNFFGNFYETYESVFIPIAGFDYAENTAKSPYHLENLKKLDLYSIIIIPLETDDGIKIGSVTLISSESRRIFEKSDFEVAEMVARRAAVSIQHAQAYDIERKASQNLRFIARASELLTDSFDVRRGVQRMLNLVVQEIADFAIVLRAEENTRLKCIAIAHHDPNAEILAKHLLNHYPYEPEAEQRLLTKLSQHASFVVESFSAESSELNNLFQAEIDHLKISTSLTIPLYSRGITYGSLVVCFTELSQRTHCDWDLPLFDDLGRRTSIAIENAYAYERERHISEALQQWLLPLELPKIDGLQFSTEYVQNGNEIGGDWYDAIVLRDGTMVISIGDVVGRSAKAASIMAFIRQAIAVVSMNENEPAQVLDIIDDIFQLHHKEALASVFLAFIDPGLTTIRYANAGHPYPLLRYANGIHELNESRGLPIGLRRTFGFSGGSSTKSLSDVEMLIMYTNGLMEYSKNDNEAPDKLSNAVSTDAILHVYNPAKFIKETCANGPIKDDIAILTLRFQHQKQWSFISEYSPTATHSRREFVQYLESIGSYEDAISTAEIVFGELFSNAVRHAPGPINVHLDWRGMNPVLHVLDRGSGMIQAGNLPADPWSESGRGLFIIQTICDEIRIERIPGYGNQVSVVLPIERNALGCTQEHHVHLNHFVSSR